MHDVAITSLAARPPGFLSVSQPVSMEKSELGSAKWHNDQANERACTRLRATRIPLDAAVAYSSGKKCTPIQQMGGKEGGRAA
jgi:hypothetical protein